MSFESSRWVSGRKRHRLQCCQVRGFPATLTLLPRVYFIFIFLSMHQLYNQTRYIITFQNKSNLIQPWLSITKNRTEQKSVQINQTKPSKHDFGLAIARVLLWKPGNPDCRRVAWGRKMAASSAASVCQYWKRFNLQQLQVCGALLTSSLSCLHVCLAPASTHWSLIIDYLCLSISCCDVNIVQSSRGTDMNFHLTLDTSSLTLSIIYPEDPDFRVISQCFIRVD